MQAPPTRISQRASRALREAYLEVFVLAAEMRARRVSPTQIQPLHDRIDGLLRAQRQVFLITEVPQRFADLAHLAVVALVDESARYGFGEDSLHLWESFQYELFQQENLGNRFFTELKALRNGFDTPVELLELFSRCLSLGFSGEYAPLRLPELQTLRQHLENQLAQQLMPPPPLASHLNAVDVAPAPVQARPLYFVLLACGLIALLAISLTLLTRSSSHGIARQLDHLRSAAGADLETAPEQGGGR